MLRLGILFFLFLKTSVSQNGNEVCTLLSICNNLELLKSKMAAVREEQKRQTDILERLDKRLDTCTPNSYPESCANSSKNKLEIRVPEYSEDPFEVSCDQESHGGGWTVVMRRNDGSQNFLRKWWDYKPGFGNLDNEFFMGLNKLHAITASEQHELLVLLEDYGEDHRYQMFDNFRIGPEANNYTLESLGSSYGTAGDSLAYHLGSQFSTTDNNNDSATTTNCAAFCMGAWWYRSCNKGHLFGVYGENKSWKGIYWPTFGSDYGDDYHPMKRAAMMIRPKRCSSRRS
ncbi:microfibril-associated glycoprotein 4-like [Drosophila takahashii]|uniref:microfibril-associated glycoprotein 4-like n=1 Tax=Drosophila takahashii TaxID=29030 RepID=UPI001CF91820|nr:microfibril-associated glycoprotein 4-like [Drosophila takahashii]